jgi:hypothetical protein
LVEFFDSVIRELENGHQVDLLEELNKQRKKNWEETVESTRFVHSSRKAWNFFEKTGLTAKMLFHQRTK